ncbi:hypothetical protein HETIRDRAFT_459654 [Heterobasidion irregulare TC 32-1]|uniref:Uncharacterized protein n=1 Tax=Heterobasidion irregulare (strain TC 32-1) TaxID=747525 RepID=W4K3I4_HETIT|nr:uncharacterized protein HETIRDRAFT_459654 [Heterobasidion irregulare TC 32-1]ETW79636.1 hypothetical protein HETIRDRAFT_459654 [Heterobasidion irregulare TC 32-1]
MSVHIQSVRVRNVCPHPNGLSVFVSESRADPHAPPGSPPPRAPAWFGRKNADVVLAKHPAPALPPSTPAPGTNTQRPATHSNDIPLQARFEVNQRSRVGGRNKKGDRPAHRSPPPRPVLTEHDVKSPKTPHARMRALASPHPTRRSPQTPHRPAPPPPHPALSFICIRTHTLHLSCPVTHARERPKTPERPNSPRADASSGQPTPNTHVAPDALPPCPPSSSPWRRGRRRQHARTPHAQMQALASPHHTRTSPQTPYRPVRRPLHRGGGAEDANTLELPTRRCKLWPAHTKHARRPRRPTALSAVLFTVEEGPKTPERPKVPRADASSGQPTPYTHVAPTALAFHCPSPRKTHNRDLDASLGFPRAGADSGQPTPDTKLAPEVFLPTLRLRATTPASTPSPHTSTLHPVLRGRSGPPEC